MVAGTGPLLLAVAAHLARRGAKIVAVCEQAPLRRFVPFAAHLLSEPAKLLQGIAYVMATRGARLLYRLLADCGEWQGETRIGDSSAEWEELGRAHATTWHADIIWCPIWNWLRCWGAASKMVSLLPTICSKPRSQMCSVRGNQPVSAAWTLALLEGQIAGLAAAGRTAEAEKLARRRRRRLGFVHALRDASALDPQLKKLATETTLVCRCEDVSYGALREHACWRDAKLQTRCGMGPCQGRICGAATEFLFGWDSALIESNIRPPIFPAMVSSLGLPHNVASLGESLAQPATSLGTPKETR